MANDSKLNGIHPILVAKVQKIQAAMAALGFPMKVVQGLRTADQQAELYASGRTKPGKIVTNCDGIKLKSNHQAKDDGYGHAVDMAFDASDPFADSLPWDTYGACAKALGLVWGGAWISLKDRPHIELPK